MQFLRDERIVWWREPASATGILAVVSIPAVSMLSFSSTGIPNSGPCASPRCRSRLASARFIESILVDMNKSVQVWSRSIVAAMRFRYDLHQLF